MRKKWEFMRKKTLNEMDIGTLAKVKEIQMEGSMKRRLLDMGLIKDSMIECALESALGDPKAYYIRGTLIAIRNADAKKIWVEGV